MIRRYPPWDVNAVFGDVDWKLSTRSETCGLLLGTLVCLINAGLVIEIGIARGFYTSVLMRAMGQSLASTVS